MDPRCIFRCFSGLVGKGVCKSASFAAYSLFMLITFCITQSIILYGDSISSREHMEKKYVFNVLCGYFDTAFSRLCFYYVFRLAFLAFAVVYCPVQVVIFLTCGLVVL